MAKKNKVPKKIAGVKLPKALRRGLRDLAASQNGRQALTDALAAAGTALAAAQAPAGGDPALNADSESETPRNHAADVRAATVTALEDAARAFTDALKRCDKAEAPTVTTPPMTTPPSAATH